MISILEALSELNQALPLFEVRFLTSDKYGMTIEYNPSRDRIGDDYFKAYRGVKINDDTPFARISFFRPEYVIHNFGTHEPKWNMDMKDRQNLMALLNEPNQDYPTRTNWKHMIKNYNLLRQDAYLPGRDKNVVFLRNQLPIPDYLKLR